MHNIAVQSKSFSMKSIDCILLLLFVVVFSFFNSCTTYVYTLSDSTIKDGKYDSEFPTKSPSKYLEDISKTIRIINSINSYETYIFSEESAVTLDNIMKDGFEKKAVKSFQSNNTMSGTGTIIYKQGKNVAVLTCSHVVSFPDTVISYFKNKNGSSRFIKRVSIQKSRVSYISDFPDGGEVYLLCIDKNNDVALLGRKYNEYPVRQLEPFSGKIGSAEELEWGTFVYLFGFPMLNKMVTTAVVSSPNKDLKHSFLLDASFNRGFSGGIVVAIRDGVPNFELVGMITSVPAENYYMLTPAEKDDEDELDTESPYSGDIYIQNRSNIIYGVTRAISIETIKNFLTKNKEYLELQDFHIDSFFQAQVDTVKNTPPPKVGVPAN